MIFETGFEGCVAFHQTAASAVEGGGGRGGHLGTDILVVESRTCERKCPPGRREPRCAHVRVPTCSVGRGEAERWLVVKVVTGQKPAPKDLCKLCPGDFPTHGSWAAMEGMITSRAMGLVLCFGR